MALHTFLVTDRNRMVQSGNLWFGNDLAKLFFSGIASSILSDKLANMRHRLDIEPSPAQACLYNFSAWQEIEARHGIASACSVGKKVREYFQNRLT